MDNNMMGSERQRKIVVWALVLLAGVMAAIMVLTNKKACPPVPTLVVRPSEGPANTLAYCLYEKQTYPKAGDYVRHVPLGACAATKKQALVLLSLHQSAQEQRRAACIAKDTSLLARMRGKN